ncbi:MAG: hypothetical protein HWN67_07595 [Candidatus Helarchaeota archaeon]|nr:hypothetical protein [Candidatus Helarchaeota archaeon]
MRNEKQIIDKSIKLFNLLELSDEDKKLIGNLYLNSSAFGNLSNFTEKDNRIFLKSVLKDQDRYFNPLFFIMASSVLLRTIRSTEILSEIIVNLNLLQFQKKCNHRDYRKVYKKRFSTYFPVYKEKEISLCEKCFIDYFETKIAKNLPHIDDNDIVGMGVSGEKDSMAALKAICELIKKSKIKNFKLIIFFIDEGLKGPSGKTNYREICEESVKKICNFYGLPLKIYRYQDLFGFTIDDLYKMGYNPCNSDSRLMSIVANKFAYENKITKSFVNLTENESFQFACLTLEGIKFNLMGFSPAIISKIKINNHRFMNYIINLNIKDEENRNYLECTDTQYNSTVKCPYGQYNIGKLNSPLINKMEEIHPGAITNFNDGLNILISKGKKTKKVRKTRVKFCPVCKFPSLSGFSRDCFICNMKKEVKNKK